MFIYDFNVYKIISLKQKETFKEQKTDLFMLKSPSHSAQDERRTATKHGPICSKLHLFLSIALDNRERV